MITSRVIKNRYYIYSNKDNTINRKLTKDYLGIMKLNQLIIIKIDLDQHAI